MCAWIRHVLHVDPDGLEPEAFAERWREAEYLIKVRKLGGPDNVELAALLNRF